MFRAIWYILGPFGMFRAIWYILGPFGNVSWYISPRFWYIAPRKIWQPWWQASVESILVLWFLERCLIFRLFILPKSSARALQTHLRL
jgi:hypothetical protein